MFGPAATVAGLSVGIKLIGFIRDQLIAARFGTSSVTDAFLVGSMIPNFVAVILASGVGTAYLPIYSRACEIGDTSNRDSLNHAMLRVTLVLGILVGLLGALTSRWTVRWIAPTLADNDFRFAVLTSEIAYATTFLTMLGALLKSVLTGHGKVYAPSWAGLAQNLVNAGTLLALAGVFGANVMPIGAMGGALAYVGVQLVHAREIGTTWSGSFTWTRVELQQVLYLSIPVMLTNLVNQTVSLVERGLAIRLSAGSVAALSFADKVRQIPVGLWLAVVTSVIFPLLAKTVAAADWSGFRTRVETIYRAIIMVSLPLAVMVMAYSRPLIEALYERGAFGAQATSVTAVALICYAPGIVGLGLTTLLDFVLYSLHDSRTPLLGSLVVTVTAVVLDLLLIRRFGHAGLALGSSLAVFTGVAVQTSVLVRRGHLRIGGILKDLPSILLACSILTGVLYVGQRYFALHAANPTILGTVEVGAVTSMVGGGVYIIVLRMLKVQVNR